MKQSVLLQQLSQNLERGIISIPCHLSESGGGKVDKQPRGKQWEQTTLEDCQERFCNMLKQSYKPVNGIGVLCGKDSDLTVVDYDTYQDDEKFDRERFETLFDDSTYTVNTLNKGKHYYFKYNKDIKQTQGKVLDIRSDKGFVVSPPTTFGDKVYEEILTEETDKISKMSEEQITFIRDYLYPKKKEQELIEIPSDPNEIVGLCLNCFSEDSIYLKKGTEWIKVVKAVKLILQEGGLSVILDWSRKSSLYIDDSWVVNQYTKAKIYEYFGLQWLKRRARMSNRNLYYNTIDNDCFSIDRMKYLVEGSEYPLVTAAKYFDKFHHKILGSVPKYTAREQDQVIVYTNKNLKEAYANAYFVYMDDEGKKKVKHVVDAWLAYEYLSVAKGITFKPNFKEIEEIVDDKVNIFRGGMHKYDPKHIVDMTQVSPWLNHLREVWCDSNDELYDYLIGRLAQMFQKPYEKCPVEIVVRGPPGCCKSCVCEFLGYYVLGEHLYGYFDNIDDFLGNFNADQATTILNHLDELNSGGTAYKMADRMKSVAAKRVKKINEKYGAQYTIPDYSVQIKLTNHFTVTKIEQGDRREFMLKASEDKMKDPKYGENLNKNYNNVKSGYEMFHYFLNYDLTNWDQENIPSTDWKMQSQLAHITPTVFLMIQWLYELTLDVEDVVVGQQLCPEQLWLKFSDKYGKNSFRANMTKDRVLSEIRDFLGIKQSKTKKIQGKSKRVYDVDAEEVFEKLCTTLRCNNDQLQDVIDTFEDWTETASAAYMKDQCHL